MDNTRKDAIRALVADIQFQANNALVEVPPFEYGLDSDWQTRLNAHYKALEAVVYAAECLKCASGALARLLEVKQK